MKADECTYTVLTFLITCKSISENESIYTFLEDSRILYWINHLIQIGNGSIRYRRDKNGMTIQPMIMGVEIYFD